MLPRVTLPDSLRSVLALCRPCFRRDVFQTFCLLVLGLIAQTGRRTVCGILLGAGITGQVAHDRFHRFFSTTRWDVDRLGLTIARLIIEWLLPPGAPITVAVDDTLFKRWGKKIFGVFWTHDGSVQGPKKIARGNRWIIAGIVVTLPWCSRPTCLPVLFRLWQGKGRASPVELAATVLGLLATEFSDRTLHGVGDAAYRGGNLADLPAQVTFTTRMARNGVFYAPKPAKSGRQGRPKEKGERLGTPGQIATNVPWHHARVDRYGRTENVQIAQVAGLWYGSFGKKAGRLILIRDEGSDKVYDLALFATDLVSMAEEIVARYAARWPIEVANAQGKGPFGIGQARNRTQRAVERTVPFEFLAYSLVIVWYAIFGHHPEDVADRRARSPWYTTKAEPSFEDILAKLRRTIIAARFLPDSPGQATPEQIQAVHLAWEAAAA
jgi:hypothetical protein